MKNLTEELAMNHHFITRPAALIVATVMIFGLLGIYTSPLGRANAL
jgi:hypothetical protein